MRILKDLLKHEAVHFVVIIVGFVLFVFLWTEFA